MKTTSFIVAAILGVLLSSSPSYSQTLPEPVAYWSFDDCTAVDSTGNGNNGVINGRAVCVDGIKGKALRLNGASSTATGDYVKVPWNESFRSNDFTIAAWVNLDGGECRNGSNMVFSIPAHDNWDNALAMDYRCDQNLLDGYIYSRHWFSKRNLDLRWNWHHLVMTKEGTTSNMYIDGQLAATMTGLDAILDYGNPRSILIGADDDRNSDGVADIWWLKGVVDEVQFYTTALTQIEITQVYQKMKAPPMEEVDVHPPTGAVNAYDNVLWSPNNKPVPVAISGYVFDEMSATRDGSGCGISSAYLIVNGERVDLTLGSDCTFQVTRDLLAVKDAVYPIELYGADTKPESEGGPNFGLVSSTAVRVPHDMGK